jgi:hypothetical protein
MGVNDMSDQKIFGYDWADIQRAQNGGRISRPVQRSADIDHSESDRIALETHGIEGLKKLGYFGVLDRLKTTGVIES